MAMLNNQMVYLKSTNMGDRIHKHWDLPEPMMISKRVVFGWLSPTGNERLLDQGDFYQFLISLSK